MIPSKIILAGEYTILDNSQLIGIPFRKFSGTWKFSEQVDKRLEPIHDFLKKKFHGILDIPGFYHDINNGIYFHSDIPEGYGCGSSGALVAGICQRYLLEDLANPIQTFSEIESYFHGKSSGLDPYISFRNKPVLIVDNKAEVLDDTNLDLNNFYLFDSKIKRSTKNLVQAYTQLSRAVRIQLAQKSNDLVKSLLTGQAISESIQALSKIQLENMKFAIPTNIQSLWEKSLYNDIYFKLCGAGGGGFFLVYSTKTINHPDYIKLI